jgi:hypothetical protein
MRAEKEKFVAEFERLNRTIIWLAFIQPFFESQFFLRWNIRMIPSNAATGTATVGNSGI